MKIMAYRRRGMYIQLERKVQYCDQSGPKHMPCVTSMYFTLAKVDMTGGDFST